MMELEKEYIYHLNVIYNVSRTPKQGDTELSKNIAEYLVQKVESWGYNKTYYDDRDALPGKDIFKVLFDVIRGSKFTVVILTQGFVNNCWSKYCQKAAFKTLLDKDNSETLIPVVVSLTEEEIPDNLINSNIIYFDKETWSRDTPKNKQELKKLEDCLSGKKQLNETGPNSSQNNSLLTVDGPESLVTDTDDGAEAIQESTSASNLHAESMAKDYVETPVKQIVMTTQYGSHSMTGATALPNTNRCDKPNARQLSEPTSGSQAGNRNLTTASSSATTSSAMTIAMTTKTTSAATTTTNVPITNYNDQNSNFIDHSGSMDYPDLTMDNGSHSHTYRASSTNINDNEKAKYNRNYANLRTTNHTVSTQENQSATGDKSYMNRQSKNSSISVTNENISSVSTTVDTIDYGYESFAVADLSQARSLDGDSILHENCTNFPVCETSSTITPAETNDEYLPTETLNESDSSTGTANGAPSDISMVHTVGHFLCGRLLRMAMSPDQIYLG